jgi:hypothetical protein
MRRLFLVGLLAACGSVSSKPDASVQHDAHGDAAADAGTDASTCVPRPSTLVSEWRGESNANDSLSHHYNGTAVGNVTYTAGKHGQAFLFDGSSSYVTINDGDALWPSGSFSLEAWVNTTHSGGDIMEKYACWNACPANMANALWVIAFSNGNAQFEFRPDAANAAISSVTDSLHSINDGQWHHMVGVRDVSSMMMLLYVDGALAVSASLPALQDGPMSNLDNDVDLIAVGASPTAGATTFTPNYNGAADELAYYNGALSATEVAAHFSAPTGICP